MLRDLLAPPLPDPTSLEARSRRKIDPRGGSGITVALLIERYHGVASNSCASGRVGGRRFCVPNNRSAEPSAPFASPAGPPLDAFAKRANGDWIAKKDVMVPGPGGMLLLKTGQQVDDELLQRLDDECK